MHNFLCGKKSYHTFYLDSKHHLDLSDCADVQAHTHSMDEDEDSDQILKIA